MILLLDIGNTRIKWAQLLDGALTPQQSIQHGGVPRETWMRQLFRERFRPARLLVANVAGDEMAKRLRTEAKKAWGIDPEFAESSSVAGGVTNAYPDPKGLGVDRWLATLAAYELAGGAACAIDAGTAVTIDLVDDRGLHRGGMIVPGVQMMIDSLLDRTSDIRSKSRRNASVPVATGARMFGNSTALGVANGALMAVAGAADRACAEAIKLVSAKCRFLITGGDAERLQQAMQTRTELIPDLVLRGLAILARKP